MEIRVIREIRVLLNIEILVFWGWISMRGLVWVQLSIKQRVIYIYWTAILVKQKKVSRQAWRGTLILWV